MALLAILFASLRPQPSSGQTLPLVTDAEWQPLAAHARRVQEALNFLGAPLAPADETALTELLKTGSGAAGSEALQQILDRYCLVGAQINPEMRVKAAQGPARPELIEQGWRVFLVKVHNESGTTAELRVVSPQAISLFEGGSSSNASDKAYRKGARKGTEPNPADLWCDVDLFKRQPMKKELTGARLEYALLQVYSRDAGQRECRLSFNVGQGTQDLGFRSEVDVLFRCAAAGELAFKVLDEHRKATTAAFLVRDAQGRVYPTQSKRLAPDFGFQSQIYRNNGETLKLPAGEYEIQCSRGPEYVAQSQKIHFNGKSGGVAFQLERWIDPSTLGWWSGDHHIHAAGCAHYTKPTEGVHAADMIRHCLGEDLKVGCNLTWGPCFDYQKQFFTGKNDKVSKYPYLLRYDVEVSGFGSHQSGHLCLLRLKEQMYPGGTSKDHWPTLCLNTLRWGKRQGALCGPAHSGWGLEVDTAQLPNYIVPPLNGIGANEYVVDVTHQVPGPDGKLVPAVDFMSMVDTPYVWELNMWYHTLNCGFRTRISGETDFPCIYGERVGLGRSYVELGKSLDYEAWCEGIRQGRNYVSDGRSHLIDFKVNQVAMGTKGSELTLGKAGTVRVQARVAARLAETPEGTIHDRPYSQQPYWHLERARTGASREVPVEVIVNGYPVAKKSLVADGHMENMTFEVPMERSGWIALRILPSSHSNPVFVIVDGKPIRASRRSAEWCLKGVDQLWRSKERAIAPAEMDAAKEAYAHARTVYAQVLAESDVP
ncbi:MAG: CehA/McbA family metallohydrolase [Verrucomicrobia bacterium]|nr:CehA/McbA family metallohydrolase [Verrucomicrobiota bacterium]